MKVLGVIKVMEGEMMGIIRDACERLEIFNKKTKRAAGSSDPPISQFRLALCVAVRVLSRLNNVPRG